MTVDLGFEAHLLHTLHGIMLFHGALLRCKMIG